jgi:hypothetical protein
MTINKIMSKTEQKLMERISAALKIGMKSIRVNGAREANAARILCQRMPALTYTNESEYSGGKYYYNYFKKQHTTTQRKIIVTGILIFRGTK